jgi:hypothetical protein
MQWYQIVGWVIFAVGVVFLLLDGPAVVKLVAGPKSGLPLAILQKTWGGFALASSGLGAATGALWPWIVNLTISAAYFAVWAYDLRAQQRQKAG